MFGNAVVIDYVFRILNFIVLIGLSTYLFKRHFLASLQEELAQEQAADEQLRQQIVEQQAASDAAQHHLVQDEKLCKKLTAHIDVWVRNVAEQARHQAHEQERVEQEMRNRQALRAQAYADYSLRKELMPDVCATIHTTLVQEVAHSKEAHAFLCDVVKRLPKRMS